MNNNKDKSAQLCDELIQTYIKKNKAYGSSFDQSIDEFGYISPIIRISDKLNRFETLILGRCDDNGESLSDTLKDTINYTLMMVAYMAVNNEELYDTVQQAFEEFIEELYQKSKNVKEVKINSDETALYDIKYEFFKIKNELRDIAPCYDKVKHNSLNLCLYALFRLIAMGD